MMLKTIILFCLICLKHILKLWCLWYFYRGLKDMELDSSSFEKRFAYKFLVKVLKCVDSAQEFIAHLGTWYHSRSFFLTTHFQTKLLLILCCCSLQVKYSLKKLSPSIFTEIYHNSESRWCMELVSRSRSRGKAVVTLGHHNSGWSASHLSQRKLDFSSCIQKNILVPLIPQLVWKEKNIIVERIW